MRFSKFYLCDSPSFANTLSSCTLVVIAGLLGALAGWVYIRSTCVQCAHDILCLLDVTVTPAELAIYDDTAPPSHTLCSDMGDTHSKPLAEAPDVHVSPHVTGNTHADGSEEAESLLPTCALGDIPTHVSTMHEHTHDHDHENGNEQNRDTATRPSLVSVASQTVATDGSEEPASAANAPQDAPAAATYSAHPHAYQRRWLRCKPDWDTPSDLWITEDTLSMLGHASGSPHTSAAHAAKMPLPDSPQPRSERMSTEGAPSEPCHAPRPPPSQPCTPLEETPLLPAEVPLCTPRPPAGVDVVESLPTSVDLRDTCPSVYDDGRVSCSHVSAACCLYEHVVASALPAPDVPSLYTPSRLFWYYAQREADSTTSYDSGGSLRSALAVLHNTGVCGEDARPFDERALTCAPSLDAYEQAWNSPSVACARVEPSKEMLRRTLATGYPIACSIPVSGTFRTDRVAQTGRIPPLCATESRSDLGGGHALVLVGYDDEQMCFVVRNSWGSAWGDHGHGYLSYECVQSGRVASAWVMQRV